MELMRSRGTYCKKDLEKLMEDGGIYMDGRDVLPGWMCVDAFGADAVLYAMDNGKAGRDFDFWTRGKGSREAGNSVPYLTFSGLELAATYCNGEWLLSMDPVLAHRRKLAQRPLQNPSFMPWLDEKQVQNRRALIMNFRECDYIPAAGGNGEQ
jgi:hypothetical protein